MVLTYAPKRTLCSKSSAGLPDAGGAGRTGTSHNTAGTGGITGRSTVLIGVAEGLVVEAQAVRAKAVNTAAARFILFDCRMDSSP